MGKLYKQEYLIKAMRLDVEAKKKEASGDKIINETRGQFANLCSKLDAL